MSEELKSVESEEEGIVEQDSSELVEVNLDQILEYAYDEGVPADKVDAWIARNFITEQDEEGEEEDDDDEEEVPAESKKASLKREQDEEGEEEDDEEEVAEQEEGGEEEGDEEEEEEPVAEKKMSSKAKAKAAKYRKSAAGKKAIARSKKKRSRPGYKVNKALAKKMAKSRKKGGISGSYEVPGTKNQMLKNIYDSVNGMLKSDLASKYESILKATSIIEQDDEEEDEEDPQESKRTKAAVRSEDIAPINVEDDIEALTKDEKGLSENFKEKATTIFEAAVHAKVVDELNTKLKEIEGEKAKEGETFQKELTEKVDGYLTYVVEEWMSENELAIERGIRTELVEDFMSGLRTLFTEHYIDIPEEKVDMVDDLFTKVEDLEGSLDEEINRGVELQKELARFKKDDALKQATRDLADTDSEKIEKLAEGIEFENTEQYIEKLSVLKESYFPKSEAVTSTLTETDENIEVSEEQSPEKLDESMKHYTSAIRRYNS